MSTNEAGWGGLPTGLPDPAVLARMAAEFFGALPGTGEVAQGLATSAPLKRGIPPLDLVARPYPVESGVPAPSAAPPVNEPPAPAFSFLREARPLFGGRETLAEQGIAAPPSIPFQAAAPKLAAEAGGPPTPALPSGLGAAESAFPAFSFLEEARPLFSYPPSAPGPVPVSGPADARPEFAGLNLAPQAFDVETIRRDFPILRERVNGRPLVWLDNAATTQKPQSVIDRLSYFYAHENSNVHRAAHELAARATDAYESAREKVRRFLNAPAPREIVFVRGATEGINLVAQSWGRQNIGKDDEIVISWLEHHANIVPWQMLCSEKEARLRVAPVDDSGQIILEEYEKLLGPRTRLVAVTQVSNALGTVTPVREMIEAAHRYGAKVLVDGAQAVSHMRVDVQSLDCDFYVLSGHKLFAPTGIGVVYGKSAILDATGPWQGGGNMIQDVTFEKTIYNVPPARFEVRAPDGVLCSRGRDQSRGRQEPALQASHRRYHGRSAALAVSRVLRRNADPLLRNRSRNHARFSIACWDVWKTRSGRAWNTPRPPDSETRTCRALARALTLKFLGNLPRIRELLQTDTEAAYNGDPAAFSKDEVIVAYPFIEAIAVQRLAHELYLDNIPLIPRIMTEWAHARTGMDLHPGARIGTHFFVDHCTGTVVGETAIIGNHVKMYQGVGLVARSLAAGQALRGQKRHPTIEDRVTSMPAPPSSGATRCRGRQHHRRQRLPHHQRSAEFTGGPGGGEREVIPKKSRESYVLDYQI
jgi:cysteine desulfurase/selenocysteine lyase